MTDEEKKAIEKLKNTSKQCHNSKECWKNEECPDCYVEVEDIMAIDTVLNLLEKKDNRIKELESDKEINVKMIELMANLIYNWDAFKNYGSRKDIKQYFENLAKESGEIDEC